MKRVDPWYRKGRAHAMTELRHNILAMFCATSLWTRTNDGTDAVQCRGSNWRLLENGRASESAGVRLFYGVPSIGVARPLGQFGPCERHCRRRTNECPLRDNEASSRGALVPRAVLLLMRPLCFARLLLAGCGSPMEPFVRRRAWLGAPSVTIEVADTVVSPLSLR
jgi:hypothetical protein